MCMCYCGDLKLGIAGSALVCFVVQKYKINSNEM